MILKIRSSGLRAFWERGETKRLNQEWINKIDRIMNALDKAESPADLEFPGYRLHALRGEFQGYFSVRVSRNWRITFRFEGSDTTDIDLIDYH
ncbi:MAG: type II toxin-antitoxin system RelE/ParE family toxin [Rhodothermia bacterium]